jgi:hypothetical protein
MGSVCFNGMKAPEWRTINDIDGAPRFLTSPSREFGNPVVLLNMGRAIALTTNYMAGSTKSTSLAKRRTNHFFKYGVACF